MISIDDNSNAGRLLAILVKSGFSAVRPRLMLVHSGNPEMNTIGNTVSSDYTLSGMVVDLIARISVPGQECGILRSALRDLQGLGCAALPALPAAVPLCGHTDPIVAERAAQTVEVLAKMAMQGSPRAKIREVAQLVIPALADACEGSHPSDAARQALANLRMLSTARAA